MRIESAEHSDRSRKTAKVKKFLSYYKLYRNRFAVVLACALTFSAASMAFPKLAEKILTLATQGGTKEQILAYIAFAIGVLLLEAISSTFFDYHGHCIGAEMENDLRQELYESLERQSFSFFDRHRTGELMSSLTNDLNELAELFHHGPEDYLVNGITFLGVAVILFLTAPPLAILVFCFLPPMAYMTLRLNRYVRKASEESAEAVARINATAEETLNGIRVTQSFRREDTEIRKFRSAGSAFMKARKRVYGAESVEYQSLTLLTRLMYLTVIAAGAYAVGSGRMQAPKLLSFVLYLDLITQPVKHLAWMTTQYQRGLAGFDRVYRYLNAEPSIREPSVPCSPGEGKGSLELKDIVFRYEEGKETILNGLSLKVMPGEHVALAGISGVGKTTLCSLIPRFYEPLQGEILLDGKRISDLPLSFLRDSVSVVRQDTWLFSGTVAENIAYGKEGAGREEIRAAAKSADAETFILALPKGYETPVGPNGVRLSGGQRQRIAIARAFLKDAPVLILDEATSSLDPESERSVHKALKALRAGRTTLTIAHRLSTLREADRICMLREGRICETGTADELLEKNGEFAHLYEAGQSG